MCEALTRNRVQPQSLIIEVTESALMRNLDDTMAALSKLKDPCVSLSIDDVGAGYSSPFYMKHVPTGEVKVDRSFIIDVRREARDAAIVKTIIMLGRSLGMRVVAEGIEMSEQPATLARFGCDHCQGYAFSPPNAVDRFAALLRPVGQTTLVQAGRPWRDHSPGLPPVGVFILPPKRVSMP